MQNTKIKFTLILCLIFTTQVISQHIKKLINMISVETNYDNISKSSAYYHIMWIKKNLNTKSGNLSTKQHKQYLLYLIDSIEDK